jgi:[protein-PII] uridylyltransferase
MPQVAHMLGFYDEKKLVSKVLEAHNTINTFTKIFVKKMIRRYLSHSYDYKTLKASRITKNFYNLESRLYATYSPKNYDIAYLLEVLVNLEDIKWEFDPSFLFQFTYVKINYPLKNRIYQLLKQLFCREHFYPFLKLFYDAGIIHHLFSSFKKVMHLPQFDGYHQYSVVFHSIKCVEALENIQDEFILNIYKNLDDQSKMLLKIVTLLHDSGKGRLQDHSEVGVKLITSFGKNLKLKESAIEQASLLVRHHVLMNHVAFRENIYNEKTLYKFMSNIKSVENLTLLYILTYADMSGVGKDIYTSFGANLLKELYLKSLEVSDQSSRISDASKRLIIEKKLQHFSSFSELNKILQKKILSIESNLFFFKNSILDIINISTIANGVKDYKYNINFDESFNIEIYRRIPLNLGFLLGSLSYLNAASMDIFTLFDETKYFKIEFLNSPDRDEFDEIKFILDSSFDMSKTLSLKKPKIKKSEITLDYDHSLAYAQLNIHTANQLGLLAFIVSEFDKENINIATAKIHTTNNRARDHFLIEKKKSSKEDLQRVINKLLED